MAKDLAKSSDMPDLTIINYSEHYKLTDMFINDLKKVLGDLPYVEAQKFFKRIDDCNRVMPVSQLNEFIRDISYLPYKVVFQIMGVIGNKDNFLKYFAPIPAEAKEQPKK